MPPGVPPTTTTSYRSAACDGAAANSERHATMRVTILATDVCLERLMAAF
jgi:hypothetical protein